MSSTHSSKAPNCRYAHSLAATQAGDLFDTNRMKLRTEGRYGLQAIRPQALAVVSLSD